MDKATFEPRPDSAKAAREFVRRSVGSAEVDAGVAVLLASELATNAIVHTGRSFDVWVDVIPAGVWVAVEDRSPTLPAPRRPPPLGLGGRGLAMVAALADRWGVARTCGGKQVWFRVATTRRRSVT
jgi:anti-sigma regulatory factor (Ser/Thr protein kinase)